MTKSKENNNSIDVNDIYVDFVEIIADK